MRADMSRAWHVRDRALSDNVLHVLAHREVSGPVVFWAHNGHLARAAVHADAPSAGMHLAQVLGPAYAPVALTTTGGTVRVIGRDGRLGPHALDPAPPGALDDVLGEIRYPQWGVVLDDTAPPPLRHLRERMIGGKVGGVADDDLREVDLPAAYDALLHVRATSASTPMPSAERPGPDRVAPVGGWTLTTTAPAAAYAVEATADGVVLRRTDGSGTWGWARLHRAATAPDELTLTVRLDHPRSAAWWQNGDLIPLEPGTRAIAVPAGAEIVLQLSGPGSVSVSRTTGT
jgi:hypothetical protein